MFSKKHKNGDEENQRKLENTSRWEDVKVIIAMVILVLIAIVVVLVNFFVTFKEVKSMKAFRESFRIKEQTL